jgi:hypothetical protein
MNQRKDEIEDILHSLDGIRKATANPYLYEKIKNRLESGRTPTGSTFLRWALAGVFIITLNIVTWIQTREKAAPFNELNTVATQLGFSSSPYQYQIEP